jgi:hypothetical protein
MTDDLALVDGVKYRNRKGEVRLIRKLGKSEMGWEIGYKFTDSYQTLYTTSGKSTLSKEIRELDLISVV